MKGSSTGRREGKKEPSSPSSSLYTAHKYVRAQSKQAIIALCMYYVCIVIHCIQYSTNMPSLPFFHFTSRLGASLVPFQ